MQKNDYKPRLVDRQIKGMLYTRGIIVLEGPRGCGKTRTASQHSQSELHIANPEGDYQNLNLALLSPGTALSGATPRLLDEWRRAPDLFEAARREAESRNAMGQFIFTSSSAADLPENCRAGRVRMRPMSLFESGDSSGKVSLSALINNCFSTCTNENVDLETIASLIVRGGWPGNLGASSEVAGLAVGEYLKELLENDVNTIYWRNPDAHKMHLVLRALARFESHTASIAALKTDIDFVDGENVDDDTIRFYIDVLDKLFILDKLPAYNRDVNPGVRMKQSAKYHFADPSLACALLNIRNAQHLMGDVKTCEQLFKGLCTRDLRIYAESFGAKLYRYEDYKGYEMDAAIELADKRWCGVEIRLGAHQIDSAAERLLHVNQAIRKAGGVPAYQLFVISGLGTAAYRRPDGVYVVPITMLKP